jgi:hypothetical protein
MIGLCGHLGYDDPDRRDDASPDGEQDRHGRDLHAARPLISPLSMSTLPVTNSPNVRVVARSGVMSRDMIAAPTKSPNRTTLITTTTARSRAA